MLTNKNVIRRTKFNISLIGERDVGKSAIVYYLKNNDFREDYYSNYIDYYIDEAIFLKKIYKFKIFDTPGYERYKSIVKNCIEMSDGFMIVFSVIDRNSFKTIDEWMNYINYLLYKQIVIGK